MAKEAQRLTQRYLRCAESLQLRRFGDHAPQAMTTTVCVPPFQRYRNEAYEQCRSGNFVKFA